MSQALTARHVALDLIGTVLGRERPLDEAIDDNPGMAQLSLRDRAFARLLVATVLRRLGQIDHLIAGCLANPLPPQSLSGSTTSCGWGSRSFCSCIRRRTPLSRPVSIWPRTVGFLGTKAW